MLTDAAIRRAIRQGRNATLTDGTGKGSGRLALQVLAMPTRVLAEWYAVQWLRGKRRSLKLGTYPALSLADARERFALHAEAIERGRDLRTAKATSGTVAELFAGYVAWLETNERPSAETVKYALRWARSIEHLTASDVTTDDVVSVLRPIYARGAVSMADHVRSYLSAAFGWGLRSENDYRADTPKRFGLRFNPAACIPSEPKKRGERWLTGDELRAFWAWLSDADNKAQRSNLACLQMVILTGQRVTEIARLRPEMIRDGCAEWPSTKNKRPHVLPLPWQALRILEGLPTRLGWFFPAHQGDGVCVTDGVLLAIVRKFYERTGIAPFSTRDLRRTWKTLAGEAGLSKEDRDRLQNHARWDVSSVHYDRYSYLPEKRAAVERWAGWFASKIEAPLNRP